MKKSLLLNFLLAVSCCLFAQCAQSPVEELSTQEMSDRQLLEFFGYDTRGMIECEEFFLLKPDLLISKTRLEKMRSTPETRMQKNLVYGLLSEENQTVYIMDKNADRLKDALHAAVNEWNSIESNLRFVIDNNRYGSVDIYASDYGYGAGTYLINIENPEKAGEYGKYVSINFNQHAAWATDYYEGRDVMMHALGHLAGFGHAITNTSTTTPPQGHIDGTVIVDPESIMRTEQDVLKGYIWNGFSRWDREAIKKAYPILEKPSFTLNSTPAATGNDGLTLALGTTYSFTAQYVHSSCPNPKYEITVKKTGLGSSEYELKETGNGTFTIKFTKPSEYKISVKVTNATKSNLIEKTYHVTDPTKTDLLCSPEGEGTQNNQLITQVTYTLSAFYSHPACPDPIYEISIDRTTGYHRQNLENGKITVQFTDTGTYIVTVTVANAPLPTKFKKTYVITDPTVTSINCSPAPDGFDENELTTKIAYTFQTSYSHPVSPNPTYEISIENIGNYDLLHIKNGMAIAIFSKAGNYKVIVKVTNTPIPVQFEKIYYVYDPPVTDITCSPEGKGENKNSLLLNKNYTFTASYLHQACSNPQYDLSVYRQTKSGLTNISDIRPSIKYYELTNIGNGIISVKFIVPGTYKIIATVTNLSKPYQFEKTYIVPEQDSRVRINGPTKVNTWDDFSFNLSYRNLDYPHPEFIVNVRETTFNDPQYSLQQINNNTISIFFAEPGNYIIEASIKDAPKINIGKYFVPAFDELACTLQEPVIVNTTDYLNEYATEALFTNIINEDYLQTRIAFYVHIKKEFYLLSPTGNRHKIDKVEKETKLITMRTEFVGTLQLTLPVLREEIQTIDPFIEKIIVVPSYEKVTFPDLVCREYDPVIDD